MDKLPQLDVTIHLTHNETEQIPEVTVPRVHVRTGRLKEWISALDFES